MMKGLLTHKLVAPNGLSGLFRTKDVSGRCFTNQKDVDRSIHKGVALPMSSTMESRELSASSPAPIASPSEASILPRIVTLLTPVFAILAAVIAGWVGQMTGAVVDQGQLTVLMSLAATSALTAAWKWMQGWQQHERMVALGSDVPKKPGPMTING